MTNFGNKWLVNPFRYPTAQVMLCCYSLRKVVAGYGGNCIKVRRSSDNTTSDIGFSSDVLDIASLLSFVGTGFGYIDTWYDQSGNGNNQVQATTAAQPIIVGNGELQRTNKLVSIYFNTAHYLLSANNFNIGNKISIFTVGKSTDQVGNRYMVGMESGIGCYFYVGTSSAGTLITIMYGIGGISWPGTIDSASSWKNNFVLVSTINNGNSYLYTNGTFESTIVNPMGDFYGKKICISTNSGSASNRWVGYISEVIIYKPSIFSLRQNVESAIKSYYSLPFAIPNSNTASAFLTITGIVDATITSAINTLVSDLITNSLWNKIIALYPFVGGTADTHKYNLKDPRDTNDAFRLSFQGGFTHSATGALPNGSTGIANTHILPNDMLGGDNIHMSFYSRTSGSAAGTQYQMGCLEGASLCIFIIRYTGNTLYSQIGASASVGNSTTHGFFIFSKKNSGKVSVYLNAGTLINEATSADHYIYNTPVALFGRNNSGTLQNFDNKECAFASIGVGLSAAEAGTLNTIVQAFQTTLGRNV